MKILNKPTIFLPVSILVCVLAGCQKDTPSSSGGIPAERFALAAETKTNLPTLKLMQGEKQVQVSSCDALIKQLATASLVETDDNYETYGDYQSCLADRVYQQATTSTKTEYQGDFAALIHQQLDVASFRSSLGPALQAGVNTFKGMKFNYKTGQHTVEYDTDDWLYRFSLLAKGDFNRDGQEDLLVGFLDQSKTASYYTSVTLVLRRSAGDQYWKAEEVERFFK